MDVVVPSICLSSVAGALLFYAGGRIYPREAPREAAPASTPEIDLARAGQASAEAALAEERARATVLRADLAGERAARARADAEAAIERRRLGDEATRQSRAAADLGAELAALRAKAERAAAAELRVTERDAELERTRAALEKAEATARRLSGEATALRARATTAGRAETELSAARAALAAAEASAADAARLRQENERLGRAVSTLEATLEATQERARAAGPDLAEAQRRSLEAAMMLRTVEQRAAEIERREAEDTALRRRVDALQGAAAEAAELRHRVRDLEAHGFARRTRTFTGVAGEPDAIPAGAAAPELSTSLELGLRDLTRREEGCRAAVLADYRGLLIAAYGDASHRDEIAAAASILTTAAERLRELLPLGEATCFTLVDEHETFFRARLLGWGDERFLLGTLGAAPPAGDPAAEAMRARIASMIGAG